jgi:hypothetical protein
LLRLLLLPLALCAQVCVCGGGGDAPCGLGHT